MYLYQATKDPFLLEVAVEILEAIEHNTKTPCGYATVSSSVFSGALSLLSRGIKVEFSPLPGGRKYCVIPYGM